MIRQFGLIKESEKYDLENATSGYLPQFSISANAMYLSDSPEVMGQSLLPQEYLHWSAALLLCACENSDAPFASGTIGDDGNGWFQARSTGKIVELQVEEATKSRPENPLGKSTTPQFRLQMKNLQAQISALRSASPEVALQLAALEERLAKQRLEKARTERLIAAKSVNRKALDDIVSEISYLERTIAANKSTFARKRSKSPTT